MQTHRIAAWVCVACCLVGFLLLPSSCAQVAGLGDLERVDCLDNCEAGVDSTASGEGGGDDARTGEGGGRDGNVEAGCPTACTGTTPVCDTSTDTCVACLANADCGPGTICVNKACTPGCAANHPTCLAADGGRGDCDIDAGVCRQCLVDTDCGGANPRCDVDTFQCVPCLPTNDNCAVGTRCVKQGVGMYTCARGCRTIADCLVDAGVGDAGAGAIACCNNTCIDTRVDSFNCGMCANACGGDGGAATTCCSATCHDKQTDPNNCGGCGVGCSNNHMAARTCGAGACNGTCTAGFSDCNANKQTDGCEVATGTDPQNCGGCGVVCSNNNMATRTCAAGACNGTCIGGNANCDNTKQLNGCNVSTSSDPNNCGGCGVVCSGNNIPTRTCASGACNGTCAAGSTNCDNTKQQNGCNVDTNNDPNNCGGCGIVCSGVNVASRTCSGGVCNGTCVAGTANCDNTKQQNGCNVSIASDPSNCGGCGIGCSNNNMATRTCGAGVCNGTCAAGTTDCNNNKQSDGCEVNTASDPNNCGGCAVSCSNNNMATRTCSGGTCNGTCLAGTANCDNTKQMNGCNVNDSTDPNNCGGCGVACSNLNMQTRTCGGGACNGTCTPGFADCTGNLQANGCETAITTTSNCSGCGLACDTTTNSARSCNGTTCSYTCNGGRRDCNGGTPPDTDGCECALNGCCGTSCATTTHSDGLGQSYFDCVGVGTYNATQAAEACAAFTGNPAQCSTGYTCTGGHSQVCSDLSPTSCACWEYAGSNSGHVYNSGAPGSGNCFCPLGTSPGWN